MSDTFKVGRFCRQYAQIMTHRFTSKQAQLSHLIDRLKDTKRQHKDNVKKLIEANDFYLQVNLVPELHHSTLIHIESLICNVNLLNKQVSDLELSRKKLELELKYIKLKQQVVENKIDKLARLDREIITRLEDRQIEQLWALNRGRNNHA